MRAAALITVFVLVWLLPNFADAQQRTLKGRLVLIGPEGEATPAEGVDVTLQESGDTVRTKALGLFHLFLPDVFKSGETITLLVNKDGWRIQYPLDGEAPVPAELAKEINEVRLLPLGSKKFWTDARIEKFIADTAERAKQQVTSEGRPEDIDFGRYIQEWAAQYGFSAEEAKAEIDQWVGQVQKNQDDFYRLGLAAYAEKNFGKAFEFFLESGEANEKRRDELTQQAEQLTEKTIRDFRLAGDAAFNNYAFIDALAAYERALNNVSRTKRPRLWAAVLNDVAKAHCEIGIRTRGQAVHDHLHAAVAAYRAALEVRTRSDLPQQWATTQNNLGVALSDQGTRTGDEDGRRLLGEAVSAYRAALEVRTLEHLPPQWAQTTNNLAKALVALEDWRPAADAYRGVLAVYPDYREGYENAHWIYHEKLFAFSDAFALNEMWLARHGDDTAALMSFAEVYITTGRFEEGRAGLERLLVDKSVDQKDEVALRALKIVTLVALHRDADALGDLALLEAAASQDDALGGWTFTGTKHFLTHHNDLNSHLWLVAMLTAIEANDRQGLEAAIAAGRSALSLSKAQHSGQR